MKQKKIVLIVGFFILTNIILYAEEDYLKKADKYFNDGKFNLAEIFYKKVLEKSPDNFKANLNLGKIYFYNSQYEQAIKHLQTSYDVKQDKETLFLIANCYIELKQFDKGLSIYSNILKKNPDYADVHLNAGLVNLKYLYKKEPTIYHWETFLKLRPNDPQSPSIKKALEYLKNPDFVLSPPEEKTSKEGSSTTTGSEEKISDEIPVIIKGKDLKTETEEKYKLKEKKTITTE